MIVNTRLLFTRLLPALRINAVCDVGSMDGADALRFRAALPGARIFAFEPHPDNFARMQSNSALRQQQISVAPLALTNYDGTGEFFAVDATHFPATGWQGMSSLHRRFAARQAPSALTVRTARLDTFLAGENAAGLRLALWIDTEGKAYEVIEGAARLLPSTYLLHVEVETRQCISSTQQFLYPQIRALLHSAGFIELARDLPRARPQFNVLFVRADLPMGVALQIKHRLVLAGLRALLGRTLRRLLPGAASWLTGRPRADPTTG